MGPRTPHQRIFKQERRAPPCIIIYSNIISNHKGAVPVSRNKSTAASQAERKLSNTIAELSDQRQAGRGLRGRGWGSPACLVSVVQTHPPCPCQTSTWCSQKQSREDRERSEPVQEARRTTPPCPPTLLGLKTEGPKSPEVATSLSSFLDKVNTEVLLHPYSVSIQNPRGSANPFRVTEFTRIVPKLILNLNHCSDPEDKHSEKSNIFLY